MIPVKIHCLCGQKYAFEVEPHDDRMPVAVACPACQRDGTEEANRSIARTLQQQTPSLPPPAVTALLNSAQSSLAPQLMEALKQAVVQELAAQRRELLAAQQNAAAELTELAQRLEEVQTPLLERLHAYEQRITELEADLAGQSQENRELLKLKIDQLRQQLQTERVPRQVNFN